MGGHDEISATLLSPQQGSGEIRQAGAEPKPLQRPKTLRFDQRARDTVANGRPLPQSPHLTKDLAEEDG